MGVMIYKYNILVEKNIMSYRSGERKTFLKFAP